MKKNDVADVLADHLEVMRQVSDVGVFYKDSGFPVFVNGDLTDMQNNIRGLNPASDFELYQSIMFEFKRMEQNHWDFRIPYCYRRIQPFIPLIFSSRLEGSGSSSQQVVYVKSNVIEPGLYESITQVNTDAIVGQTIVSIDGVPALEALANAAQRNTRFSTFKSNNFANDTQRLGFAIPDIRRNLFPENLSPKYVFRDKNGVETTMVIPWAFVPREKLFGENSVRQYPDLSTSTKDLIEQCRKPWDVTTYAIELGLIEYDESGIMKINGFQKPQLSPRDRDDKIRSHVVKKYKALGQQKSKYTQRLPNGNKALPFTPINAIDTVSYGQLGKDTTVLKIDAFFSGVSDKAWVDMVTEATEYACDNSETIIIDYTTNSGGAVFLSNYLSGLFNPDLADGDGYKFQVPIPDPVESPLLFNSLIVVGGFLQDIFGCFLGLEAVCYLKEDGSRLTSWSDVQVVQGVRGKEVVNLSEVLTYDTFNDAVGVFDHIPQICPGKFLGKNLILVNDGAGASGGAIQPASLRKLGVNVGYHGVIGETMWMGFSQGGIVVNFNLYYSTLLSEILEVFIGADFSGLNPYLNQAPLTQTDFRFEPEVSGVLDPFNLDKLIAGTVLLPDIRLPIWDTDDPSVFYTQVLHGANRAGPADRQDIWNEYQRWIAGQ